MASRNRGLGAYRSGWRKKEGERRRWTVMAEDGDSAGGSDATEGGGKRGEGGGEAGRRNGAVGGEERGRGRMKKKPVANSGRVPLASKTKVEEGKTADEEDTISTMRTCWSTPMVEEEMRRSWNSTATAVGDGGRSQGRRRRTRARATDCSRRRKRKGEEAGGLVKKKQRGKCSEEEEVDRRRRRKRVGL